MTGKTLDHQQIYDVSMTLRVGMLAWPGNPPLEVASVKAIASGDSSNISLLRLGTHTGTHVDAPRHFIDKASGVDSIPLDLLVGTARLFQLPEAHHIDRVLLERLDLEGVTRLLLGTRNSALLRKDQLETSYAFVSSDGALYLVEKGIRLVGVDYLSIEEYRKAGRPTHHTLLGSGVIIIEGMDFTGIPPGDYELICLPLKILESDGAPARVLLRGPLLK